MSGGEFEEVSGLDNVTTYHLLHRRDFGFGEAPSGACMLLIPREKALNESRACEQMKGSPDG